jgi:hypothetical protein
VESVEPTEVRSFSEGGTGAILLVDDEELNRKLGMDLQDLGWGRTKRAG